MGTTSHVLHTSIFCGTRFIYDEGGASGPIGLKWGSPQFDIVERVELHGGILLTVIPTIQLEIQTVCM